MFIGTSMMGEEAPTGAKKNKPPEATTTAEGVPAASGSPQAS